MRRTARNPIIVSLTVIVFILLAVTLYTDKKKNQRIANDHIVVCGTITDMNNTKSGWIASYEFVYNDKKSFKHSGVFPAIRDSFLVGKSQIRVVLEKNNPNNCELLMKRDDYEKYNITAADTAGLDCNN